MDSKFAALISFHDEAFRLWDYLDRRSVFFVANGPYHQHIWVSIEEHYTSLMGLYHELDRLKPLHGCVCNQCTCVVAGKFAAYKEEDQKIHHFLVGLDDDLYATTHSTITIPKLNRFQTHK